MSDLGFERDVILYRQEGEALLCATQGVQSIARLLHKHGIAAESGNTSPLSTAEAAGLLAAMVLLVDRQADCVDRVAQRSQK